MDGKRTLVRLALVAGLIGIELYLAGELSSRGPVQGYTATSTFSIAPMRAARIKEIAVTVGAPVSAGDVIARLDTTEVDNELAAANAERRVAAASIVATTARLRRDSVDLSRRFASSSERASADLVTAEASAHTAAAELAAVDAELAEQKDLVGKRLATATLLNSLQLKRAALAKQVDAASSVLRILRENVTAATRRNEGFDVDADELAPLQAKVHAADLRIAQLTRERDGLTLRAPANGVIETLALHAGDLATPQAPVGSLVALDARRVIACIPELRAKSIEPGTEADVTATIDRTRATGAVESITGAIGPLPPRCQPPYSKAPAMGRVAVIALDEPLGGVPGQTQLVRFSSRRRPHPRAPSPPPPPPSQPGSGSAPPVSGAGEPAALGIPSDVARMNFEPSGLVWLAGLDRYVIVSDDTGLRTQDGHPAWLHTMTRDGLVDPVPLVVSGVDELDDLESITLDDRGGLWVLASQSFSRKGKRPLARRRLAHLILERGTLRADRVVDLGTMLDGAPRAELGISDMRALDIEAMAFQAGALYLGLKAPVDGDGRAIIWRVAAPDKLLAGDLAGAQLSLWSRVKLTVDVGGKPVPGGLSDMIFWDADTLVLATTASGIDAKLQDGAIYVAKPVAGTLTPRHVRTFPNLKPEGLARGPKGELAVVFDRGVEPAMWVTISGAALKTP